MTLSSATDTKGLSEKDQELEGIYSGLAEKLDFLEKPEVYEENIPEALRDHEILHKFPTYYEKNPEFKEEATDFKEGVVEFLDDLHRVDPKKLLDRRRVAALQKKWKSFLFRVFEEVYNE
jgi:hypothetical protein